MLPGYVFVYAQEESAGRDALLGIPYVIRMLCYGADDQNELLGRDLEFAEWLWKLDGRIGAMKALKIGDRIEIIDGFFK